MGFIEFLIVVGMYAYLAYSLQTIAAKTGTDDGWLAWIPIANIYLSIKIARKPGWWLILYIIPIVNLIITAIVWAGIAKARYKEPWFGILMLVPIVDLIIPGYLAFSD